MTHSYRQSWGWIFEDYGLIIKRMSAMSGRAEMIIEGKSTGIASRRKCKKWLLENIRNTEYEQPIIDVLRGNYKDDWKLPEFIRDQLRIISDALSGKESNFMLIKESFNDILNVLDPKKKTLKSVERGDVKVASLGLECISFHMQIMPIIEYYLTQYLYCSKKKIFLDELVPQSIFLKYVQLRMFLYLMCYASMHFISYSVPVENRWCLFCFRRSKYPSKYCKNHNTNNNKMAKSAFRFGYRVHSELIAQNPSLSNDWKIYRNCIVDNELREGKQGVTNGLRVNNWKVNLINLIKKSPALARRLPVEKIMMFDNWPDAVKFLREELENPYERSYDIVAVWSWLHMAEKWFETEDDCIGKGEVIKNKSRSPISNLSTEMLIENLCEKEPGITKTEISKRLKISKAAVGQYIENHNELQKYFK